MGVEGKGVEKRRKKRFRGENDVKPIMGNEDFKEEEMIHPIHLLQNLMSANKQKGPLV